MKASTRGGHQAAHGAGGIIAPRTVFEGVWLRRRSGFGPVRVHVVRVHGYWYHLILDTDNSVPLARQANLRIIYTPYA